MTDKTETPLTDAATYTTKDIMGHIIKVVHPDSMAKLERQLAAARQAWEDLTIVTESNLQRSVSKASYAKLEAQLAEARKDGERLDWLLSGYAICRWAAEDNSRNDEVLDSRQAIDAAIRRHLTPMEAERKFAQANKETGSTDEV